MGILFCAVNGTNPFRKTPFSPFIRTVYVKVTNIQKSFNGHHVLKGIDFEINKGEVVAILGPSGSGKTTFLRCLNLLERPEKGVLAFTDGSLTIDFSKKISKSDELKLRRRSSMVFQQYNLFPHRTALEM